MQTREGCFQATQKVAGGVVFIERLQVKSHFATLPSLGEVVTDDAVHVIAAASQWGEQKRVEPDGRGLVHDQCQVGDVATLEN